MYSAIVFDVNETLLDLKALDPAFEKHFGLSECRKEWFNEVLKLAFVNTILGTYSDFGVIGKNALKILERRYEKSFTEEERNSILSLMRTLPPHKDVPVGLDLLHQAGFSMVALTNSTPSTAESQLTHAGIRGYSGSVYSVDRVKCLKPAPAPYEKVANDLGVAPNSLLMVAAHAWDIAGAMRVGLAGAFLAHPGQILDDLTPQPAYVASDLVDLSRQILTQRVAP